MACKWPLSCPLQGSYMRKCLCYSCCIHFYCYLGGLCSTCGFGLGKSPLCPWVADWCSSEFSSCFTALSNRSTLHYLWSDFQQNSDHFGLLSWFSQFIYRDDLWWISCSSDFLASLPVICSCSCVCTIETFIGNFCEWPLKYPNSSSDLPELVSISTIKA